VRHGPSGYSHGWQPWLSLLPGRSLPVCAGNLIRPPSGRRGGGLSFEAQNWVFTSDGRMDVLLPDVDCTETGDCNAFSNPETFDWPPQAPFAPSCP
jgi:hypothetical protein